jgi:phosphatidylinositol glycan class M
MLFRLVLVYIADVIDNNSSSAKYTDIDYSVFTDAATMVYNGKSPYQRHTYRYTPLVAYMAVINNYTHYVATKLVFCICDILVGIMEWEIIDR